MWKSPLLIGSIVATLTTSVSADIIPPPGFGPDIGGSGYFDHVDEVASLELGDSADSFSLNGSTFGMYFKGTDVSDASNLFTIFSPDDDGPGQTALINFSAGLIFDVDENVVETAPFTDLGLIGFFLIPSFETGLPIFFSDPLLNPGNIDVVSVLPKLDDDSAFIIAFEEPTGSLPFDVLAIELAIGLTPVPEPSQLPLLGMIFLGWALVKRRPGQNAESSTEG